MYRVICICHNPVCYGLWNYCRMNLVSLSIQGRLPFQMYVIPFKQVETFQKKDIFFPPKELFIGRIICAIIDI